MRIRLLNDSIADARFRFTGFYIGMSAIRHPTDSPDPPPIPTLYSKVHA
jgi:hypothetical protein